MQKSPFSTIKSVPNANALERQREEAWIGDAVLTLYARLQILSTKQSMDASLASRMTSNQFLSAFGEPTAMEAKLGRIYQEEGLASAFSWIETNWMPLFRRQEENRLRKAGK